MRRSVFLALAVMVLPGPGIGSRAADKDPPPAIEGRWESPARYAGKGGEPVQTIEFKEGRMVWIEPRQPGDKSGKTGLRIEAEYSLSKTGRVYGMVLFAGGSVKLADGDTFSFVPKMEGGVLQWEDVKGPAEFENVASKLDWRRVP